MVLKEVIQTEKEIEASLDRIYQLLLDRQWLMGRAPSFDLTP